VPIPPELVAFLPPYRGPNGSCVVLACSRETGHDQVMLIAVRSSVVYHDDCFRWRTSPRPLRPKVLGRGRRSASVPADGKGAKRSAFRARPRQLS
jgi:hypothetical protein